MKPAPEGTGVIRLEITPYNGTTFHVHELKVMATFAPTRAATQPAEEKVQTDWSAPQEGVQIRLRADRKTWRADEIPGPAHACTVGTQSKPSTFCGSSVPSCTRRICANRQ